MQEKVTKKGITYQKEAHAAEKQTGAREKMSQLVIQAGFVCIGWLMGQADMLFGSYPLGLGLLCASSGRYVLSVLIGLIVSSVMNLSDPTVYICTYVAAALVRAVSGMILENPHALMKLPFRIRKKLDPDAPDPEAGEGEEQAESLLLAFRSLFTESVALRMTSAAVCSMIISLYRLFLGGFLFYDLFATLFLVAVTPSAVLIYSVAFEKRRTHPAILRTSEAALLLSTVWASRDVIFLGLPLPMILGVFCTLLVCRRRGFLQGVLASVLCGLAMDVMLLPAFLIAALVYSFLYQQGKGGTGLLLSVSSMLLWAVYAKGALALLLYLPACLLGGALLTVFEKLFDTTKEANGESGSQESGEEAATESNTDEARMANARCRESSDRFRGISEAFTSLSEVFYNLSDRHRRPGTLDLRHICDGVFDRHCAECPNRSVCWGLEYSATLGTVNALISQLHTRGRVTEEQIPQSLTHRCDAMDAILGEINEECARLTGEMLKNNRTEIFAMDYESAASIINDALEEDDGEYRFDPELAQKVSDYLSDAGISASSVTVFGNRRRQIVIRGADVEGAKISLETLRSDLGEMCGLELGSPVFEVEGKVSVMSLQAKKKLSVLGARNSISADGGVCGDSLNLFSNRQDYFYALISDGMGAGKEAAFTSGLCSVFLEKMLRAGNRAGTSLRMLNNMIRSREADSLRECSSTVDLLELDLMTSEGTFIKSGAAPSFVIRGSVVHRLQSGSAPIGIIRNLDAHATSFYLRAGDTVVMVSDGILQNDDECEWLTTYLTGAGGASPEEIVYRICLQASRFENHDDCSAIALRICDAQE
ncbi:MAG: SpoIIE family protein phosphatase [Clostridia bacterium]|nr:SpoIIE family protein phosphatase [Clostridia bacterium]